MVGQFLLSHRDSTAAISEAYRLIFVIGCPGAGKGALLPKLAKELGFTHISVGYDLRHYAQKSPQRLETLILTRVVGILNDTGVHLLIVDGFPREWEQIEVVESEIGSPERVIFLDCPRGIAKARVLSRNLKGRVDSEEIFEGRYDEFDRNNVRIMEHYEVQGKIIEIDSSQEVEVSWSKLLAAPQIIERVAPKDLSTIEALEQLEGHIESTVNKSGI